MTDSRKPRPGVSREARISDEGLQRLEAQFERGARPSRIVLEQWIKRYGHPARELMKRYGITLDEE